MVRNLSLFFLIISLMFPAFADEYKSAYDRVMKTQTIRCAYIVYSPYFIKDANTGKTSGIFYELTEELAKNAALKIEWTEEVGYEDIFTGLSSNRYDAFCAGLWPNANRSKIGTFSIPVFYSTVTIWGRHDEMRFKNIAEINNPETRIATIDGALESILATTDFPLAQNISSPSNSPFSTNYMKITSGKADITFAEVSGAKEYAAANPNTLKQISSVPLRVFENTMIVAKGEYELKEIFDVGLTELLNSGRVETILQKYEKYPGSFMRVAKPYEPSK